MYKGKYLKSNKSIKNFIDYDGGLDPKGRNRNIITTQNDFRSITGNHITSSSTINTALFSVM